jgi:hypothetical protein
MSRTQKERREWWRQLIVQQERSGLSVRTFCRRQQTSEHSFYQWRKRLSEQVPVKFALVETQRNAAAEAVELTLATGERLRIGPGVDSATIRAVLSVLREPR